jgi:hypothetical protein
MKKNGKNGQTAPTSEQLADETLETMVGGWSPSLKGRVLHKVNLGLKDLNLGQVCQDNNQYAVA